MMLKELNLEPRQVEKYERWLAWVNEVIVPKLTQEQLGALDEDCVVTSPIKFTLYGTGLGTVITVEAQLGINHICTGLTIDLSIDDDNEMVADEWPA